MDLLSRKLISYKLRIFIKGKGFENENNYGMCFYLGKELNLNVLYNKLP